MYGFNAVTSRLLAFAENTFGRTGAGASRTLRYSAFLLGVAALAFVSQRSGAEEIDNALEEEGAAISRLQAGTGAVTLDIDAQTARLDMANVGKCGLLVLGNSTGNSAPLYFLAGPAPMAGLQADVIVGPGITVTSIDAGPAATKAGKVIQAAPVPGGERFLLFGFNQSELETGLIGTVNFDMTAAGVGPHIVALVNFVAANAAGSDVPMCVTTGVITK